MSVVNLPAPAASAIRQAPSGPRAEPVLLLPSVHGVRIQANAQRCMLGDGMTFRGRITLAGPCCIAGELVGSARQAQGQSAAIVVTASAEVTGDLQADRVSVLGRTSGTIDAAGGEVSLLRNSKVAGLVRYARLQVDAALVRAVLEPVTSARAATPASNQTGRPSHDGRVLHR